MINLEILFCFNNKLKNLNEIKNLHKLGRLECENTIGGSPTYGNPWEEPLPLNLVNKFSINYTKFNIERFSSYEYQEEFLEEHPERVKELEPFGFNDKIKEEYKELLKFFNVKI